MKLYQLASIVAFLLLKSCASFSPRPSCKAATSSLHYSDVAEDIAIDTEQNVQVFDSSLHNSKAWQSLVPLIPGERGCDVTIQWKSPHDGAQVLLQHLFPDSSRKQQQQQQDLQPLLENSFATFQSLLPNKKNFKARVVATRGSSGTKCPRWHVDHVPLRWIQALVGPGCDYVMGSDGIDWNVVNGMETVDEDANMELVDENVADVRHAPEGQGVVLLGAENEAGCFPAVHKSPSLNPFQGRVLLTLDVVRE